MSSEDTKKALFKLRWPENTWSLHALANQPRTLTSMSNNRHNHFKNASCYYEWRSHWRYAYKRLSNQIASLKDRVKYGDHPRLYQGVLASLRCEAHAMMIAREAVTEQYRQNRLAE